MPGLNLQVKSNLSYVSARRSISRVLYSLLLRKGDDHSSRTLVTECLMQPTRITSQKRLRLAINNYACYPYLVLLPVGFTVPPMFPLARCALTTPFHPYLCKKGGIFSVALSLGLPPPGVTRHRVSVEPGLSSKSV